MKTDVAVLVEAELERWLGTRRQELRDIDAGADRLLAEPLARLALRGGQRMRARCAVLGWRAAGGAKEGAAARPAAVLGAALELLQVCALVHDDIMDGSRTRRGEPTLHEQFAAHHRARALRGDRPAYGTARALLAGDLALVWAEDLYREVRLRPAARRRADDSWRAMRTEMVVGQQLDLELQAGRSESVAASLRMAELKTARYTVERPLHIGAAAAGAHGPVLSALRGFGLRVGVAFQLRDDLLGVFGDPAATGKPCGDDIRQGKRTYLVNLALSRARTRGDTASEDVLLRMGDERDPSERSVDRVRSVLTGLGADRAVEQRISRMVREGVGQLAGAGLDPDAVSALELLAAQVSVP
ncbi:polyprenyl synthetase family protein [Streptomyces sp. NPDC012623]|uniref:polyprenyl synthetase family protein n=1 Tax=unclassified Streptomyces TaxID=2593676 RepID=UPI0036CAAA36